MFKRLRGLLASVFVASALLTGSLASAPAASAFYACQGRTASYDYKVEVIKSDIFGKNAVTTQQGTFWLRSWFCTNGGIMTPGTPPNGLPNPNYSYISGYDTIRGGSHVNSGYTFSGTGGANDHTRINFYDNRLTYALYNEYGTGFCRYHFYVRSDFTFGTWYTSASGLLWSSSGLPSNEYCQLTTLSNSPGQQTLTW